MILFLKERRLNEASWCYRDVPAYKSYSTDVKKHESHHHKLWFYFSAYCSALLWVKIRFNLILSWLSLWSKHRRCSASTAFVHQKCVWKTRQPSFPAFFDRGSVWSITGSHDGAVGSSQPSDEELTHLRLLSQVTGSFRCALKSDHGCSQNDGKRPIINRICCYRQ